MPSETCAPYHPRLGPWPRPRSWCSRSPLRRTLEPVGRRPAHEPRSKTRKIAPGLTYIRIVQRQVPLRTFVLRIDLSKAITLDTTIADDACRRGGSSRGSCGTTTRSPCERRPRRGTRQHRPPVRAGRRPPAYRRPRRGMFAVSKDESSTFSATRARSTSPTSRTAGVHPDRWNRCAPERARSSASRRWEETLASPPSFSCSVRLLPQGPRRSPPRTASTATTSSTRRRAPSRRSTTTGVSCSTAPGTDEAAAPRPHPRHAHASALDAGLAGRVRRGRRRSDPAPRRRSDLRVRLVQPSPSNRDRRHRHGQDPPGRDRRPPAPVVAGRDAGRAQNHPEASAPSTR